MRRRAVIVVVAALTIVAGACSSTSTVALRTHQTGALTWKPCGHVQCATLSVPLDWQHPAGTHITLALARLPSRSAHAGVLLTNPGGPGGSGIEFMADASQVFDAKVLDNFDI